MSNPRVDDETKKTRGTYRKDREYKPVPRDPDETMPRRPSALQDEAAVFWYRYVRFLWDDGWLCRKTKGAFVQACTLYQEVEELAADIKENKRFVRIMGKEVERPQSKVYNKLRTELHSWYKDLVITGKAARDTETAKAKKKKKTKPSLDEFTGPQGIAK